jgi:DNA-binding NtrC family response regulator
LVIDDVREQKDIASMLLTKLGYSVTSVSSGEEAIEYMKIKSANLLILDMIMDPGIDDLQTYKDILKLHPGQKAIIASGFSETDRIKEAHRLGASQYVRKPYALKKMGLAVKTDLEKQAFLVPLASSLG